MPAARYVLHFLIGFLVMSNIAVASPRNQLLGTWRMVSARLDPDGANVPAYGKRPNGLLSFTADMHFVEVLTDADVPRFASNARGQGTDMENRIAMASSIGFFGTYTVDDKGEFSGNQVDGSTFPNWVGAVRSRKELRLAVEGNTMTENFQRPDGVKIVIHWERVR